MSLPFRHIVLILNCSVIISSLVGPFAAVVSGESFGQSLKESSNQQITLLVGRSGSVDDPECGSHPLGFVNEKYKVKGKIKMAVVLKSLYNQYHKLVYEYSDPRTNDWFLVGTPWPVFSILIFYHYFVQKIGIEFMKDRKPFNLNRIIQVYNAAQVVLCLWFFVEAFCTCYGPTGVYSWRCEPIDYSNSPTAVKVAKFVWGYYMIKIVDLLDTVFFVLRKKTSQVTFLHVYHHTGMVIIGYAGTKYMPGGHGVFLGMINCFVHAVMYTYYFLTNYNPEYRKKIWWKKYITQMQMIQFLAIMIHFSQIVFQDDCKYPKWAVLAFLPQNFFMFILFWDFYNKAYLAPKKAMAAEEDAEKSRLKSS